MRFPLQSPNQSAPSSQGPLVLVTPNSPVNSKKDLVFSNLCIATDVEHCIFPASISHRQGLYFLRSTKVLLQVSYPATSWTRSSTMSLRWRNRPPGTVDIPRTDNQSSFSAESRVLKLTGYQQRPQQAGSLDLHGRRWILLLTGKITRIATCLVDDACSRIAAQSLPSLRP